MEQIAEYFSLSPYLIARENGIRAPLRVGQILALPAQRGNRYVVKEGDTKELLCGSEENFRQKNGTDIFYIGMRIIL